MKIVDTISKTELKKMAENMYGTFVKGVVDVSNKTLAVDSEMHVDLEQYLLEHGSKQENLWGINLHPDKFGTEDFVEFDSMINIRPRQNNMSRFVEDEQARQQITNLVMGKING